MVYDKDWTTSRPVILGFVLLLICATCATWLSWRQSDAEAWVRHTFQVENRLSRIQVLTMRADINRGSYLLTGSTEHKQTYLAARREILPQMRLLASQVSDNPPQEQRALQFQAIVVAKLGEMQRSIDLYEQGQPAPDIMLRSDAASRALTGRLLRVINLMKAEETQLLATRRASADRLKMYAVASLGLSALFILILAAFVERERRLRLATIVEANRALELDIVARTALEKELEGARERAEAAVAAKSSFLANMSHEIRTPMNGVLGFTDLLLASDLSDTQRREAQLIADSGRAMMRLLNDILDISKVEAGQMRIAEEPFDLPHALRTCAKLLSSTVLHKGLELICDVDPDLPKFVIGDGLRLRQIVLNLLGNATKFTLEGHVALRARRVELSGQPCVTIEVEDSGIGIAPENQVAIFDHFVQAESNTASRFGGTGLGLSISAQLARLMGGHLHVESVLGTGSKFILTLPLTIASAQQSAEASAAPATPLEEARRIPPAPGLRVLVAEDHDVNQLLILAMLEQLGYAADLAHDGEQAIAMAEHARAQGRDYSVVLMDVQMPAVGGCEATHRLRANGFTREALPIIAVTANAYADDIAECLNAGMQAHITKPVQLSELEAALRRWVATPAAERVRTGAARFSPHLQERYAARRSEMLAMVDAMVERGRFGDADLSGLADTLHRFAGSAALFGDAELGTAAHQLELGLASWSKFERSTEIRAAAEALRKAA